MSNDDRRYLWWCAACALALLAAWGVVKLHDPVYNSYLRYRIERGLREVEADPQAAILKPGASLRQLESYALKLGERKGASNELVSRYLGSPGDIRFSIGCSLLATLKEPDVLRIVEERMAAPCPGDHERVLLISLAENAKPAYRPIFVRFLLHRDIALRSAATAGLSRAVAGPELALLLKDSLIKGLEIEFWGTTEERVHFPLSGRSAASYLSAVYSPEVEATLAECLNATPSKVVASDILRVLYNKGSGAGVPHARTHMVGETDDEYWAWIARTIFRYGTNEDRIALTGLSPRLSPTQRELLRKIIEGKDLYDLKNPPGLPEELRGTFPGTGHFRGQGIHRL